MRSCCTLIAEAELLSPRDVFVELVDEVKGAWDSLIDEKPDFLKADLYVFQLFKLYSWGFKTVNRNGESDTDFHFVRAIRPQPRGASRH